MNNLECISTKQLIDELCTRPGIKAEIAEPYQDITVSVNGSAIVIVITDYRFDVVRFSDLSIHHLALQFLHS